MKTGFGLAYSVGKTLAQIREEKIPYKSNSETLELY